jgi:hypothetical protein
MQKMHPSDAKRPFEGLGYPAHYAARINRKADRNHGIYTYLKRMHRGGNMSIRNDHVNSPERLATAVLDRPRELFGESLPELALVTAIVAAVISATVALSG